MKKAIQMVSLFLCAALLAGCGGAASTGGVSSAAADSAVAASSEQADAGAAVTNETAAPVELTVFAAASLTETLNKAAELYKAEAPHVTLTFNFDSSGTLKTQIEEGAMCDVFLSAGQKQMNQLDATADATINTEHLDFVDDTTRFNILENNVTLAVPEGNPKGVQSFDDLAEKLKSGTVLMAMGNEDVPVGQYTQKLLAYYQLDEAALAAAGSITYGSNVKEVTTQISEGTVDCGVIYATDAYSAGLTVVDRATKEMCGQVIYPAAMLKGSTHPEEAKAFLEFLKTPAVTAVFTEVGFTPLSTG